MWILYVVVGLQIFTLLVMWVQLRGLFKALPGWVESVISAEFRRQDDRLEKRRERAATGAVEATDDGVPAEINGASAAYRIGEPMR
jgi:hypothetical protein